MALFYLQSPQCFESYRLKLKQISCPHCHGVGFLIRHGFLRGYGSGSEIIRRGWRLFCSNRQRRRGCGRTHGVLLAEYLARRSVTASVMTGFLKNRMTGLSLTASWPICTQGVECAMRIWGAWKKFQAAIRCALCSLCCAPASAQRNPLLQTAEHLFFLFPSVSDFQLHFQKPFFHPG